ncbi:uncharacterized protein EV420DRAFT_1623783 [Desarmillaria tabescens]|uniref:Uncharacterized protein n=1 Tax=Armillaria tabescens TaxID=1929756 RepID=A0AA39J1R6_ARMTA|nr:uncharacterized protein EV420DRAFT_1623783 [Desarmillaria tabescens]KAK0434530.1 hypothetical protein EV420DRAFT_1623783 [Desarmillaria tabescens]
MSSEPKISCSHCGGLFSRRGIKRHEVSCQRDLHQRVADTRFEKAVLQPTYVTSSVSPSDSHVDEANSFVDIPDSPVTSEAENGDPELQVDDIQTIFHPSSGKATIIDHFDQYRSRAADQHIDPPIDQCPWHPFSSHRDFNIAEFVLDAALSERQMDKFFKLLKSSALDEAHLTPSDIKTRKDVKTSWDRAANLVTPFEKHTCSIKLLDKEVCFDVYCLNLWNWILELVKDSTLEPHFVWDATHLSKWNGSTFERFVNEPWTAQAFWDLQTALPEGGKPLYIILYADKTRLSSFGTAQGYPVVAHCGNLPVHIQNGKGVGGGHVVGWLPVIKEDPKHTGKKYYVDFKRRVWHTAMKYVLETMVDPSRAMMVLIRGVNGDAPCPICLVPKLEQYNLEMEYELRTSERTREILQRARGLRTQELWDDYLGEFGLRNIDDGLFGHHLRGELVRRIKALGHAYASQADNQVQKFPRWRDLNHFESGFMAVTFTDGTKYEDLSKQIIFVTHNILSETQDSHGYHLLKCIRSYLVLNVYAGFTLHTESSIKALREESTKFGKLIKEYQELTRTVSEKPKSWNFPKVHSHRHLPDDILAKGVSRNYDTKPNENMHGPLKDAYQLRTNFKEVAEQILRIDSWCNAAGFIQQQIDVQDELLKAWQDSQQADEEIEDEMEEQLHDYSGKATLHGNRGKGGGMMSIKELMDSKREDIAFKKFSEKLSKYVKDLFKDLPHVVPVVNGNKFQFEQFIGDEKIWLYGTIKVNYESTVNWTLLTDILRCSPNFHNHPRYDCVIVKDDDGPYFAQLVQVFTCNIGGKDFPLALIQPFTEAVSLTTAKLDEDLGFYRVSAKKRDECIFISIYSIIRGALLVEDFGFNRGSTNQSNQSKEYLVVDVVDEDMYLCMKALAYIGKRH